MEEMKIVKDYWGAQSKLYVWDEYVLKCCIESLDQEERDIILSNPATRTPEQKDRFNFIMYRLLNRHSDVLNGKTEIVVDENGTRCAVYTKKSAITELDISYSTFVNCYHSMLFTIEAIEKPMLSTISLQSMTEILRILYKNGMFKE